MYIGIEIDDNAISKDVFAKYKERVTTADFPKNPYMNSDIHKINEKTYLLDLHPVYANFGIYVFVFGLIPLLFNILIATFIISGLGLFMMLIQTEYFVYYIIKRTLKKKGYMGIVRKLNKDEIIRLLWDKK